MTHVLALSGSLRKDSLNSLLLKALPALAPAGMKWETCPDLGALPPYDGDLDHEDPPAGVARFRAAVDAAAGLVIVTPEYNYSLPGVLKNAIDWASRPKGSPALTGKCISVFIASPGRALGFRGLSEAKRVLGDLGNLVVAAPEVVINTAHSVLLRAEDGAAIVSDPMAQKLIRVQLAVLHDLLTHDVGGILRRSYRQHFGAQFPD